ncbi:MAG TPA: tetratricopeptide repeat protein [Bacteroidia bacterium]
MLNKWRSCFFLFLLLATAFHPVHSFSQDKKKDSLKLILKKAKSDTAEVDALNALAKEFKNDFSLDSAEKYSRAAAQLAAKLNYKRGEIISYTALGILDEKRGNYPGSLNSYFIALKLCQELHDLKGEAKALNNIAIIFFLQKNYEDSREKLLQSIHISEPNHDFISLSASYTNLGLIYEEQGNYTVALQYYKRSLPLKDVIKDERGRASLYNNIGNIYYKRHLNDSALENFRLAYFIRSRDHDKSGLVSSFLNLGSVYISLSDLRKARQYTDSCLLLARPAKYTDRIMFAYLNLSKIDSAEKKYKNAFRDYAAYITLRDSLLNQENMKKSTQLLVQYEFGKKHAADSVKNAEAINRENLKHEQEIRQQKIYAYGGIAGFLLMLVVAGISLVAYRQKRKDSDIISQQKSLVEEKQKEILDSIHYAKRIQRNLLPSEKYLEKVLKNK